jgi:hypothetical protein
LTRCSPQAGIEAILARVREHLDAGADAQLWQGGVRTVSPVPA